MAEPTLLGVQLNIQLLFRITGFALGIQIALGGLVTFGYIDWTIHMGWGIILGILALVTLIFVYRMPTRNKRLVGLSVGLGVDILIQALIGFAAQDSGNSVISWIHFLNSYAIFAMLLMGMGIAMMGSRMGQIPPAAAAT
jgi:heme A synthase